MLSDFDGFLKGIERVLNYNITILRCIRAISSIIYSFLLRKSQWFPVLDPGEWLGLQFSSNCICHLRSWTTVARGSLMADHHQDSSSCSSHQSETWRLSREIRIPLVFPMIICCIGSKGAHGGAACKRLTKTTNIIS